MVDRVRIEPLSPGGTRQFKDGVNTVSSTLACNHDKLHFHINGDRPLHHFIEHNQRASRLFAAPTQISWPRIYPLCLNCRLWRADRNNNPWCESRLHCTMDHRCELPRKG